MRSRTRVGLSLATAAFAAVMLAPAARGAGISLQDFDGKALGMSNAFAATADNPSALFYNPAGITQLDGFQGEASLTLVQPNARYVAAEGEGADQRAETNPIPIPALFGTAELTDFLYVGLGTFVPFGLAIDWGHDWAGRYIIDDADINVVEYNLNVATKIQIGSDAVLSLAAGGSLMTVDAEINRQVDQRALGAPDAHAKIILSTNDDVPLRWNVATMLSLLDRKVRFGFLYRADVRNIDLEGRAEFSDRAPATKALLPKASRARARVNLPGQFRVGIAVDPIEPLTIELDYTYTRWHVVPDIDINFRNASDTGSIHQPFLFQWHDTDFVALGAEYRIIKDFLGLRAGIYFDESPANLKTLNPGIPDNDRYGFSAGIGVKPFPNAWIDFGYLFVHIKSVKKDNNVGKDIPGSLGQPSGDGIYRTDANLFTLTLGLKF